MARFAAVFRILLVAILFAPSASAGVSEKVGQILHDSWAGYIVPSYDALSGHAAKLESATQALCSAPSEDNLATARAAFGSMALSWAGIEWLRVGPSMEENRLERILFYPDRKSTGLKQVQRALVKEDEAATDATKLGELSVAMQGLGAYEFLLFGKGSGKLAAAPADSFACRYGLAIAENLKMIAGDLAVGWQAETPLTIAFLQPSPENPLYRDDIEALNLVIGTIIHGLEAVRDVRIGYFLRDGEARDRPRSALYRRSGLTLASIAANLEGSLRLFDESRIERALPDEAAFLADQVRLEFQLALGTAREFNAGPEALVTNEKSRKRLEYLKYAISNIIARLNDEFAPAAGLAVGFSFGDGD